MTTTYCPRCDAHQPPIHECVGREPVQPMASVYLTPDSAETVKFCLQRQLLTLALGLGRAEERGDVLLIRNYSRSIERTQGVLDELEQQLV